MQPAVVAAVVRRPRLWLTALRQLRRTTPAGWWRQWPPIPGPTGRYLGFRALTQYGATDRRPTPHDVVNYLAWCREWDRSLG